MYVDSNVYLRFYLLRNSIQFYHRFALRSFTIVTRMRVHRDRKSESSIPFTPIQKHPPQWSEGGMEWTTHGFCVPSAFAFDIHRSYDSRIIYNQFTCFTRFVFEQMSNICFRANDSNRIDQLVWMFVRNREKAAFESDTCIENVTPELKHFCVLFCLTLLSSQHSSDYDLFVLSI